MRVKGGRGRVSSQKPTHRESMKVFWKNTV